ncbi:MAG: YfbK domain-containing protein [Bacteroidota bacterium]
MSNTSDNFRWAAAVTAYSLLLQDSEFKGAASYSLVKQLGVSALGKIRTIGAPLFWRR